MAVSIYKKFFGRAHPLETFSDLRARALAACSFPGGPTQELETFKFFFIFLFFFNLRLCRARIAAGPVFQIILMLREPLT